MKKMLILLPATFISYFSYSQYVYTVKADSVKITNDSSKSELIIENTTRNVCVIGGTQGRSYVNDERDVAYMNVNMGGNTNTDVHEIGHLFGLADRKLNIRLS